MKPKENDCISYVCVDFDRERQQYLLNNEAKSEMSEILGRMMDAFTIDSIGETVEIDKLLQQELAKQTGFEINDEELGRIFNVGVVQHMSGSDSLCFLFVVNVTGMEQKEDFDAGDDELVWCEPLEVMILNSWKPLVILKKAEFISAQKKIKLESENEN
jgi:hypothetical protein